MKPDSEDFTQLRRLLALKRHEQPPPGYFDRFSGEVLARIRAGDTGDAVEDAWFARFWALIEAKPVFAGAFGAALCVLLISGIVNTDEPDAVAAPLMSEHVTTAAPMPEQPVILVADQMSGPDLTTNPVESLEALFDLSPSVQPVLFGR